jgi:hypothetical protein
MVAPAGSPVTLIILDAPVAKLLSGIFRAIVPDEKSLTTAEIPPLAVSKIGAPPAQLLGEAGVKDTVVGIGAVLKVAVAVLLAVLASPVILPVTESV